MARHCAAFGCTNSSRKESCRKKGISFHQFPRDKTMCRRWLINVRRANFQPTYCTLLCSEHFTNDSFYYQSFTNKKFVKKDAVPTLFSYNREKEKKKRRNVFYKSSNGDSSCKKDEEETPDSSDSEFIDSEIESIQMEEGSSALLEASMNEKFYTQEQLETLTKCFTNSHSLKSNQSIVEKKNQLKEKLKAKIFLKALRKQWLEAEIKAATAKRDYYESKKGMLPKLQNNMDLENSSEFETSTALRNIKAHVEKEKLASKIEKKVLKQQLEVAKLAADDCKKEYYEAEFTRSSSGSM